MPITTESSRYFRLGRTIARISLVLVISLASLNLSWLALNLLPEIFPTLYPSP